MAICFQAFVKETEDLIFALGIVCVYLFFTMIKVKVSRYPMCWIPFFALFAAIGLQKSVAWLERVSKPFTRYVDAILPVGGIVYYDPVPRWLFQLMSAAMKSDPAWRETKGAYYGLPKEKHPNKGMMFGWSVLGQSGLSFDFRVKQPWDEVKKDVFFWEPEGDEGAKLTKRAADYDVNDLLYRNQALKRYDIRDELHRIRAKTLIIHVKTDQWLRYITAEEAAKKIPGAKLIGFESPLAHYAIFRAPNLLEDEVRGRPIRQGDALFGLPNPNLPAEFGNPAGAGNAGRNGGCRIWQSGRSGECRQERRMWSLNP